eukprot:gene15610-21093_t
MSKLSEDEDYPADQLNSVKPNTRGWQSVRYCTYPQEIGFEFLDGEIQLKQIQLLSHEYKISSKVEIFIGTGSHYDSAKFKRLGYLSLNSNERSSYQARELKTVYVDYSGTFIKFVANENFTNKQNIYNQVGIVAISLMGDIKIKDDVEAKDSHPIKSPNQLRGVGGGRPDYKNPYNDLAIDMNLDPKTADKLRQLADAKAKAIDTEDYLTAKQIKSVESELKTLGSRLAQLDMAKSEAVMAEDYDLAKEIKDETDELRLEIEEKIRLIKIPGMTSIQKPKAVVPKFAPAKLDDDEYGVRNNGNNSDPNNDFMDHNINNYNNSNQNINANKRIAKVENFNVDDIPVGTNKNNMIPNKIGSNMRDDPLDDNLNAEDRPIKINDNNMMNKDAYYGEYDDNYGNSNNNNINDNRSNMNEERFPPGQHPLEGVPNFLDLPPPEGLMGKSKELSSQSGIIQLIGEYRAKCLFSKTWVLREAVLSKIIIMLPTEIAPDVQSIGNCLAPVMAIIKVGCEDKIQQVLFNAIALLEDVLKYTR